MNMLAVERHREILSRLQGDGRVRVAELANDLGVAEETIRRDLERLDNEGKLLRIHGGAVPVDEKQDELPFGFRESVNRSEKRQIAQGALSLLQEGDVIALDASSTARELAQLLPDIQLTVVTNALEVISPLMARSRIRVVATGGLLDTPTRSFVGSLAEQSIERYNVGKFFFSCKGIDLQRGLSVMVDEHARIKRHMMDFSRKSILLADGSKFGQNAVEYFASLDEVHSIFTDSSVDPKAVAELQERGLPVTVV